LLLLAATFGCASAPDPAPTYPGKLRDARGAFLVYGDTRDHDPREVWREHATEERQSVARRLAEEDPDFVVSTGDLVRCGANRSEWTRFDEENTPIRERGTAFFPALGNHDYLGEEKEALSNWFERFPHLDGRKWYDIRYRHLLIIVLDSNEENLADYEKALEVRWLKDTVERADADPDVRWIVLVSHHTAYTNAVLFSDSLWVQECFVANAKLSKKFRAYFAGHVHSYERFFEDGIHYVVSGGGGAPLNDVEGKKGKHKDLYDGPRRFHYLRVSVEKEVKVETIMLDEKGQWSVVDRFSFS
jgi:hypothetical protein